MKRLLVRLFLYLYGLLGYPGYQDLGDDMDNVPEPKGHDPED